MDYWKAFGIGFARAEAAAEVIRQWAGVEACAVCAVRPSGNAGGGIGNEWAPVGEESYKEIACEGGYRSGGRCYLAVVDKDGVPKAGSTETFPLRKVLELAGRLPLLVAAQEDSELWNAVCDEAECRRTTEHRAQAEP